MNPHNTSNSCIETLSVWINNTNVNAGKATHLEEPRYSSELFPCIKLKLSTPRPRALMTVLLFTPTFYSNRAVRFNQRRFLDSEWVTGSVALCSAPKEDLKKSVKSWRPVYSVRSFLQQTSIESSSQTEASRGFLWLAWRTGAVHFTLIGLIISGRGF